MKTPLLSIAVAFFFIGQAVGQSPVREGVFNRYDRNGDGKVTARELPNAQVRGLFDIDGDGVVTLEEFRQKADEIQSKGAFTRESAEKVIEEVTSGPEILKPGDAGIGRMIPDAVFVDLDGKKHRISEILKRNGAVIAMTSATCPVSKRFMPALAELSAELEAKDIAFFLVNPFSSESREEILTQLSEISFTGGYAHDPEKKLAATLQATTTTEVFFMDAKRTLIYRGALSDQYGVNYNLDEPRHSYLKDAVSAFLAGEQPFIEATAAPGCELDLRKALAADNKQTDVTYHRDVTRILSQNCVECHHENGIAPFALDDFADVDDRTRVIKRVVSEGTMPPWFAADSTDGEPSPWANDRSLSARDKADLLAWLGSEDKPMGDPADAPAPRKFSSEWSIGSPDFVAPLSRAFEIDSTGFMPYQRDSVKTHFTEDKWVAAYEILPTTRDVVHHVIVQVFEAGVAVQDHGEGVGGYWAAYVPGNGSQVYPESFARKLPAGATIRFTIHYTPSGVARKDRLKLGLVFADEPPLYEVKTLPLADRRLNIPPGVAGHVEGASRRLPFDLPVLGFMAHMHTRGAAFKLEVVYPDGAEEALLDIPRYDFNWQLRYDLKKPKLIPAGSLMKVTGVFDNSAANRANPDPAAAVRWGPQTHDEMLIGYVNYFTPLQ